MRLEQSPPHARLRWAAALTALAITLVPCLDALGRASRSPARLTPAPGSAPWVMVPDAASAYRLMSAAGVRGCWLVVLTGRWSRPRSLWSRPRPGEGFAAAAARARAVVDADGALFALARDGIARRLDLVMPPAVLERRMAEVAGQKGLAVREGGFSLPYDALERRFSVPDAFAAPREKVVVLVEPSFFQEGAPAEAASWLASRGTQVELGLIATDDGQSTAAQRAAALALGDAVGAAAPGGPP
ncbi:MAG TPA: hypothetical protein VML50_02040 [Anaeromyxobacter sp.]|nr:hypothetical protein [Anaeromyxobacter sp.]